MAAPSPSTAPSAVAPSANASDTEARQRRLRLLARADTERLEAIWAAWPEAPRFRRLKPPETGLAMIRARAGGVGQRFNLGEMTVSRCVVVLEASHAIGVGYVQGRDQRKAELVALFDALAQNEAVAALLERDILLPLEAELLAARRLREAKVAATKVDFFTLMRGED